LTNVATSVYFENELRRLDLLLHREILRLRAAYQLSLDEFRGLYISDQQVDNLIRQNSPNAKDPAELTQQADAIHRESSVLLSAGSRWEKLRSSFDLCSFEMDTILLALAVEVSLKYETIYAYLNNDVTRKCPTIDLALRLFTSGSDGIATGQFLLPRSRLFRDGLLRSIPAPAEKAAWLSSGFSISPEVCGYLLEFPVAAGRLNAAIHRVDPKIGVLRGLHGSLRDRVDRAAETFCSFAEGQRPVIVFVGEYGMGAEELAEAICARFSSSITFFDLQIAHPSDTTQSKAIQGLLLEQRLLSSGIFLRGCEALFNSEGNTTADAFALMAAVTDAVGPVFLSFSPAVRWCELLRGRRKLVFELSHPDYEERKRLWTTLSGGLVTDRLAADLANRFVLSPGQIRDAIVAASDLHVLEGRNGSSLSAEELTAGARSQSDQSLGKLAVRVRSAHAYGDLVLAPATLDQIKDIVSSIRLRHQVYSGWGFHKRLVSGTGMAILFSGAAGTGKTMTAGIMARDLGLDLYKIDLSGVVSKYIGETEKNLDRIFQAARSANAILFFDEADALFGKRSEVKDAHDRYANIEVAYLLQKMEEHEGVVIMATNLSKNLDEAFARRMQYIVEFPLPNARARERLWRGMFPPQAPLADDVDFPFLADQFSLAGGDIRNVVLSAAFSAAQSGAEISMRHIVPALARLMVTKGKMPSPTEFKQYHVWIRTTGLKGA
jgi:hypothetical protein